MKNVKQRGRGRGGRGGGRGCRAYVRLDACCSWVPCNVLLPNLFKSTLNPRLPPSFPPSLSSSLSSSLSLPLSLSLPPSSSLFVDKERKRESLTLNELRKRLWEGGREGERERSSVPPDDSSDTEIAPEVRAFANFWVYRTEKFENSRKLRILGSWNICIDQNR